MIALPPLLSAAIMPSIEPQANPLEAIQPQDVQVNEEEEEPTITEEFTVEAPELPPLAPASPRQTRTKELLLQFPGLSIPEAMRAARYTIDESESDTLQGLFEEVAAQSSSGKAAKVKDPNKAKSNRRPPGSQEIHPSKRSAPMESIDPSVLPPGITLCDVRPKNAAGRCLCRVQGCRKLDQANNDGFCRSHYNLIRGGDPDYLYAEEKGDETGDPWTCDGCDAVVSFHQKRCGNCSRWKNGIRTTGKSWMCSCGNEVMEPKSRCGKCHHWKGGRRVGGWKLGSKGEGGGIVSTVSTAVVDDIDRSTDWECCGEVIGAAKTRCGKCRKWRGGKRQIRWSYANSESVKLENDDNESPAVDPNVDWTCANQACGTENRGSKKRCSKCFSWRFSRKKARSSTGTMREEDAGEGHLTIDQLDALVNAEIQRHEGENGEGQGMEGEVPVVMAETTLEQVVVKDEEMDGEEAKIESV